MSEEQIPEELRIPEEILDIVRGIRARLAEPSGFYACTLFTSVYKNRGGALFESLEEAKEWFDLLTSGLNSIQTLDFNQQRYWIFKVWNIEIREHDRLLPLSVHLPYYLECSFEHAKIQADQWIRNYIDSTDRNGCAIFDLKLGIEHYWERNLSFDVNEGFCFRFSYESFDRNL